MGIAITSFAVSALAGVLATGTPPSTTPSPTARPAPKSNTQYCVMTSLTGSRIPVKVCNTRKDWLARGFDPLAPKD